MFFFEPWAMLFSSIVPCWNSKRSSDSTQIEQETSRPKIQNTELFTRLFPNKPKLLTAFSPKREFLVLQNNSYRMIWRHLQSKMWTWVSLIALSWFWKRSKHYKYLNKGMGNIWHRNRSKQKHEFRSRQQHERSIHIALELLQKWDYICTLQHALFIYCCDEKLQHDCVKK
jgi:hypothetical protein